MKKILSIILVAVFLLYCVPLTVFAQDTTAQAEASATVTVESTYADVGNTVEVNVTISNNPGVAGATLSIGYHSDLTLINAESGEAFSDLDFSGNEVEEFSNPSKFSWDSENTEATADGVILKLTFRVSEQAKYNSELGVSISYRYGDVYNDECDLTLEFVDGYITVIDYIPGDLFEDGTINTKDVRIIRQLINGNCSIEVKEAAADVNADGVVNTKDTRLLRRYINGGYGVKLLPGISQCTHEDIKEIAAQDATCTEDGVNKHWYCSNCSKYFSDADATTEITYADTKISASGHTEVIDEAVAPDYGKTGLTEGAHCSVCGTVIKAQEVVEELKVDYYSITYSNLQGADTPTLTQYASHIGVSDEDMPKPERNGYKFEGWYTAIEGGTRVSDIPAGSTTNYHLYARWSLEIYTITYNDAPVNSNPPTYTMENEIILTTPSWPGLAFTGWTNEEGEAITKITKGTTDDLVLTANWKRLRNIATPNVNNSNILVVYDEDVERYYYIYELGTIEHVVLDPVVNGANLQYNTKAADLDFTLSQTVTIENSIAESIAKTVSQSVSSTTDWSEASDWAQEISKQHEVDVTAGIEFGPEICKGKIEASYGFTYNDTESWGTTTTNGTSDSTGSETSDESSSTISYMKQISNTVDQSFTISKDLPEGYYSYVHAGNIRVFAIVTYDPAKGNYYLDTYSMLDNMHQMMLYYRDVNELNSQACESLSYNIPKEEIQALVESAYYIAYDANGGEGTMENSFYGKDIQQKLSPNTFTKTGYTHTGWELRTEDGVTLYQPEQSVCNLAGKGETVVLYAHWTPNTYDINFNQNVPTGVGTSNYTGTTSGEMSAMEDRVYDTNVTLNPNQFAIDGWIFKGWATSADGNVEYDDGAVYKNLGGQNKNGDTVDLYAVWEVDPSAVGKYVKSGDVVADTWVGGKAYTVYNTIDTTPRNDITSQNIIIDWSKAENLNVDSYEIEDHCYRTDHIDITPDVDEIYLVGDASKEYLNLEFALCNFGATDKLVIHFVDFKFVTRQATAFNVYPDMDQDAVITFDVTGNCSIRTNVASGKIISGITNLTFTGDGTMSMTAGKGANASTAGSAGGNGGVAIDADHVNMNMTGTLNVTGGAGGNGANGTDGDDGSPWYNGHSDRDATGNGDDGGDGDDGTNGGNAGKGGYAYDVTTLIINSGTLTATGGKSGNGGNGGSGGDGGQGQESGGWGTTAGDGGDGGNGGNGGNTYIVAASDGSETVISNGGSISLVNGAAGTVGKAGSAGAAGAKGMHCDNDNCGQWATSGNDGSNGTKGSAGSAGIIIDIS
ncbi:MAG: InlB B-repeat-containing protein [Clostridia bacterium]|nr:InlB B-repeat-containing protein [Clostridia bacterium]